MVNRTRTPAPHAAYHRVMSRAAVLIRTHYVDDALRAFAERLRAGSAFDVFIVADETRGPLDCGDVPKISLTTSTLASLGLYVGAPDLLWRCGDYGLYAARRSLPAYEAFWMIEPDVRLNADQPCDVLARFPGPEAVDFLAGRLRPAEADWDWAAMMDPTAGPVWRCLFSLARLSAAAIDVLYDARRCLTARHLSQGKDPAAWPNDEAFVASTLARSGLVCRDLNDFGQVYDDAGFSFWFRSRSESWRRGEATAGFITRCSAAMPISSSSAAWRSVAGPWRGWRRSLNR